MKDQLFLLKPGFLNAGMGPMYCADSAPVEGVLGFFPQLRELLEVRYLDFPRPRVPLIEALGEANQSLPVLVLSVATEIQDPEILPRTAGGRRFIDDEKTIRRYLSSQFHLPHASE